MSWTESTQATPARDSKFRLQREGTTGQFKESYRQFLLGDFWQHLRREAIARAGYRCVICGSYEPLEVHHARYPVQESRDVVALCRFHHQLIEDHKKPRVYADGEYRRQRAA